jgi:hypothetical protein
MKICYEDVLSRIKEKPTWWSDGYPRYGEFNPNLVSIYANKVALIHTKCSCGTDYFQAVVVKDREMFKNRVMVGEVGMVDPPNACDFLNGLNDSTNSEGCSSAAQSCSEIRVAEYWEKDRQSRQWIRQPELEVELTDWLVSDPKWQVVALTDDGMAEVEDAFARGGKLAAVQAVISLAQVDILSAKFWVDGKFWKAGWTALE